MLFPRRRYQVVPCDWTSKSTHPIPRHRTDSALRFPSLLPPRQPRPCPRNPREAEGAAPLPPGRRRETSYGASGKLLPFGIGGCIHHGCNVSTFSCRDVFHAHSYLAHPSWLQRFCGTTAPCPLHTPPFVTALVHPSWLQRRLVAPCLIQTPPFTIAFLHPLWLQKLFGAPCLLQTPPFTV